MTTFNKAIAALNQGKEAEASTLFSQHVIEQATKIQKSITEGLDLDDILSGLDDEQDEDFGALDAPLDEAIVTEDEVNADPDESPEALAALREGKSYRRTGDDDEDQEAAEKARREQERENARNASDVSEGRLDLTQEDNGDLTVKHTTSEEENAAADTGVVDIEALKESFELELATALVKMRDGQFADGSDSGVNTATPVGDRKVAAHGIKTGSDSASGYAAPVAPELEVVKADNSHETAADSLEPVSEKGDPKAALNAWGDDKSAVTPVPAK